MVALTEIRSANAALGSTHTALTAVFVGATSGIGLATLRAFAEHTPQPTAIIVGRSASAFSPELTSLKTLNPSGTFTFLETDVSLIANIDSISAQIRQLLSSSGKKIDLLITSQGYISFTGRETNSDGLDNSISLRYYGRIRFAQNLLPLMAHNGRVMSVLAGGQEGKIFEDDLDLEKHYSVANSAAQFATMTTLSFDVLAKQDPELGFVHVFPGLVSTGLLGRSGKGVLGVFLRWVVDPLLGAFVARKPEEAGERMLFYGFDEKYAKGSWSLDWEGSVKEVEVLKGYREREGFAERVMEHNEGMFERALRQ